MTTIDRLLNIAEQEIGYLEKKTAAQLDSKTANVGTNNYTKYARDIYPSLQGQPWCDMFVDWCFVQAYGRLDAKRLLGGFSAYTPTSAKYFKDRGQYFTNPQIGDQIFFKNAVRIYHTGIVTEVRANTLITIEGNTNISNAVIPNGGGVYQKQYDLHHSQIDGYGRPDWKIIKTVSYSLGWNRDDHGWWFADTTGSYYKQCWKTINHHKYYFNQDGYALIGWQEIDGRWYYFEPRAGHQKECALYLTDSNGEQKVGEFY